MEEDFQYYLNKGISEYSSGNYKNSIFFYDKAIKLNPESSLAYFSRGIAFYAIYQYEISILDFDKAILLNPNDALVYKTRGDAKTKTEKYKDALNDFNYAISLDSKKHLFYFSRGLVFYFLKEYKNAISDYSLSIKLNPDDSICYVNRGLALSDSGEYLNAIIDYNKALELNPRDSIGFHNRGHAFSKLEEYQKAIVDYNKAIFLKSDSALTYLNRGLIYNIIGKPLDAFLDFNTWLYLSYKQNKISRINNAINIYDDYPQNIQFILDNFEIDVENLLINPFEKILNKNQDLNLILFYVKSCKLFDDRKILTIYAVFQYYMGGCVPSYIMFDEVIDSIENYPLSNQELYYRAKCSNEIVINFEEDIIDCIDEAMLNDTTLEINNYYLGHLLLLHNDKDKAISFFKKAIKFLHAKIMVAFCTDNIEEKQKLITELNDVNLESLKIDEVFLINEKRKIEKINLENSFYNFECYDALINLKTYYGLQINIKNLSFRETFKLDDNTRNSILLGIYDLEIKNTINEIKNSFNETFEKGLTKSIDEIQLEFSEMKEKGQDIFKKIEYNIKNGKNVENELRTIIESYGIKSIKFYALILKYYYLKKKIDKETLFILTLFLIKTASNRKEKQLDAAKNETIKIGADTAKTLTGDICLKIIFGLIKSGTPKLFEYLDKSDEFDQLKSDYYEFKDNLLDFFKSEKNGMKKEVFEKKYKLENYFLE